MANVTFSSPKMSKDLTVYAVAGDRGTILAIARSHKIPIPFDCQDGECGSCLVKVSHLSPTTRYAIALTEKEKEILRQLGKISKVEIQDAEVNDMPPHHRLACQCFVRNEDILVEFEGDSTVPTPAPHITAAAARYTGGLEITSLDQFLGYTAKVEQDAAGHYDRIAAAMASVGNHDVAELFQELCDLSRLHLGEAKARARLLDLSVVLPPSYMWPDNETPERTALWAGDPALTRLAALKVALQGERRGYEFYLTVAAKSKSPEVAAMAKEFSREELEHVRLLEAWITREEWALRKVSA